MQATRGVQARVAERPLGTATCRIWSSRSPMPSRRTPPVAVIEAISASGRNAPAATPMTVRKPCHSPTGIADMATPQPSVAANASAAKKSRDDLRLSCSMPSPSPSLSDPRIASGPMQNSSDDVTNPSMNLSRSWDEESRASRDCSHPANPSSLPSIRSSEPITPPITTAPSTTRSVQLAPTRSVKAASVMATTLKAPMIRVIRPSPSVTVTRVRSGRRWPMNTPAAAPTTMAITLMRVPRPITG